MIMKAIQFKFGGDHAVVTVPKPRPKSDEVLVKVKYSALDTAFKGIVDKGIEMYFIHSRQEPLYMGYHYSGTVEAVGADVSDMSKGNEVFGFLQYEPTQSQGAFAEYITVKRTDCAVKPSTVSHQIAAASATEAITALQAMRDCGGLRKGDSILINGAGGGVGSAAVQIAKQLGAAHVTAICRTKDVKQVQQWGADHVLDRSTNPKMVQALLHAGEQFDVIFDVPNALPSSATKLLRPKGTIVNTFPTLTFVWNTIKSIFSSTKVAFVECQSKQEDLEFVGKWLEDSDLLIPIDSAFKVTEMAAAMAKQNGSKKGRVTIQVENGWD